MLGEHARRDKKTVEGTGSYATGLGRVGVALGGTHGSGGVSLLGNTIWGKKTGGPGKGKAIFRRGSEGGGTYLGGVLGKERRVLEGRERSVSKRAYSSGSTRGRGGGSPRGRVSKGKLDGPGLRRRSDRKEGQYLRERRNGARLEETNLPVTGG